MKKISWLTWIVFIAVLVFLVPRLSEQGQLIEAVQKGNWGWLLGSLIMTIGWNLGLVELYRRSYRVVGIPIKWVELLKLYFASLFTNIITPSFGLAGTALIVRDARYRGSTHVKGLLAFSLESLWAQTGYLLVNLGLLGVILLEGTVPDRVEWAVLLAISIIILAQFVVYALVYNYPSTFEKILRVVSRVGNRVSVKLRKRQVFPEGWSEGRVEEMKRIILLMVVNKRDSISAVLVGVLVGVCEILVCIFLLFSFKQNITMSLLMGFLASGIVAGAFFSGPHGVGVVEFGLTLVLSNYGVERGAATLIAIVYRGLTFWLPFFIGFFCFRSLEMFEGKKEAKVSRNRDEGEKNG